MDGDASVGVTDSAVVAVGVAGGVTAGLVPPGLGLPSLAWGFGRPAWAIRRGSQSRSGSGWPWEAALPKLPRQRR